MRKLGSTLFALGVALVAGCSEDEVGVDANFATPSGLAIAGTDVKRLFVSNYGEDSLQVLELSNSLGDLDFVAGPARYFPLRIPAGSGPTDLAVTPDGRYILVLNTLTESVRLVDADALRQVDDSTLAFGSFGVRPSSLVASPVACELPCIGRAFASLTGAGTIAVIEVHEGGRLIRSALIAVGGEPTRLALHPSGRLLFATDASSEQIIRVDLETGVNDRQSIGGIGGPIAVSRDGTMVLVGRPAYRDLVVIDDADGPGLVPIDANAEFGPLPECQQCCATTDASVCEELGFDPAATCDDGHPADRALCVSEDGLRSTPGEERYGAIFLGAVPSQIATLGESTGHPPLAVDCIGTRGDDGRPESRSFTEFAIVMELGGTALFVGLRGAPGDAPDPLLVSRGWCFTPELQQLDDEITSTIEDPVAKVVTDCPETPDGRRRIQCVTDTEGHFGVSFLPGWTRNLQQWSLNWEDLLPSFTRFRQHAGVINDDGTFSDIGTDLSLLGLRPRRMVAGSTFAPTDCSAPASEVEYGGDILRILSAPLSTCDALAGGAANPNNCLFERRIVGLVQLNDETTAAQVCPSFIEKDASGAVLRDDQSCFKGGGSIDFEIRVGDQFVATALEGIAARLSPGERIGPGGDTRHSLGMSFELYEGDVVAGVDACERYDEDGTVVLPATTACADDDDCPTYTKCSDEQCVSVLSRSANRRLAFVLNERFFVMRAASDYNRQGNAVGPAGRLPSAILVSPVGAPEPAVFVSYAASDRVLGFVPFDNGGNTPVDTSRYRLLR